MTRRRPSVAALVLVVVTSILPGCFGPDPNLTETGRGRPQVAVEFAARSPAGSEQTAVVTIANPGPGEMQKVVVAFAFVGPARASADLPNPIVAPGGRRRNESVVAIRPAPRAVSPDGVVYVFGGLAAGEEMTIEFDLVVPAQPGEAANSVTVYAGEEPERAGGARLETTVTSP